MPIDKDFDFECTADLDARCARCAPARAVSSASQLSASASSTSDKLCGTCTAVSGRERRFKQKVKRKMAWPPKKLRATSALRRTSEGLQKDFRREEHQSIFWAQKIKVAVLPRQSNCLSRGLLFLRQRPKNKRGPFLLMAAGGWILLPSSNHCFCIQATSIGRRPCALRRCTSAFARTSSLALSRCSHQLVGKQHTLLLEL